MNFFKNISLIGVVTLAMFMSGCDKSKPYDPTIPTALVHFVGKASVTYNVVADPTPSVTLQVGTTDVSASARTVTFNVSSSTGAAAGTQYTIAGGNTVTIPANGSLADIVVQANYAEYVSGRRDTLYFSLATPSVEVADFQDTVRLIIAGPSGSGCDEGNPDIPTLIGTYSNTNETLDGGPYGPYETTISAATVTSPTTATIVVTNIWDNGWGPITFVLDWTDPVNRTTTVVQQDAIPGSDAGDLNATYAGTTIAVRPYATSGPGTYSACDKTFTLNMQLGVTAVGWFGILYQVNMAQ